MEDTSFLAGPILDFFSTFYTEFGSNGMIFNF